MPSENENQLEAIPLDPEEAALLAEYDQAARDIAQQAQGALLLMIRQRKLTGKWRRDGAALVRAE